MMQFKVSPSSINALNAELAIKIAGMKALNTPYAKEQFAKASFTILSKEFIRRTSVLASANPKVYHHVYEWGGVGDPSEKLFSLKRMSVRGGSLTISSVFLNSKKPVPIDPILKKPGRNGKVVTRTSVFKNKAEMMESGRPSKPFSAKRAMALAYVYNGKIQFIKRPRTRVIRYPGGRATVGSFNRQFMRWFGNPANINATIAKSGITEKIEKNVSIALSPNGAGSNKSLQAMKQVTDAYSMGVSVL